MVRSKNTLPIKIALLGVVILCTTSYARGPFDFIASQPSRAFLGDLFGSVGGQLTGSNGLVGLLFRIFNVAILLFGSLFAGLIVTQSVIQTASQGIFMGKKGSQMSYFTLIRTFCGMALVVPKVSGYNAIQIFVMMIVTKGLTLAGNLSHEILTLSMKTPTDVLFSGLPGIGTSSVSFLDNSKLSNASVQTFYKKVIKGAVCAVEANRRKPIPFTSPSQLYDITLTPGSSSSGSYVSGFATIRFVDCGSLNINLQVFDSETNKDAYYATVVNAVRTLVGPVVNSAFYKLPKTRPAGSGSDCFSGASTCSTGLVKVLPSWLSHVKQTIEGGHDSLAPNFVIATPGRSGGRGSTTSTVSQIYLYDWLQFPIMYQSVMDVRGAGLSISSLQGLLDTAYSATSTSTMSRTAYSSFSEMLNALGAGAFTSFDQDIDRIDFRTSITPSTTGRVTVTQSGSQVQDRIALLRKMESLLSKLMYRTYPAGTVSGTTYTSSTSGAPPSLEHIWQHQGFSYFDEGAATFSNAFQRLKNRDAAERALRDPVDSLVYYTGDKWMKTYLYDTAQIVLSPARKLGETAAFISGQTTLFMFTVMRNVLADQIMRTYNIFWTFFGTKVATGTAMAITSLLQEQMWDWNHCLLFPPQPVIGTSGPRHPLCSPMILF